MKKPGMTEDIFSATIGKWRVRFRDSDVKKRRKGRKEERMKEKEPVLLITHMSLWRSRSYSIIPPLLCSVLGRNNLKTETFNF